MSDLLYIDVWLIDSKSTRQPFKRKAVLKRTRSQAWAIFPNGERRQIGATAFLAEEMAIKRWQGNLDRIRKNSYVRFNFPAKARQADDLCRVNIYSTSRRK